MLKKCEETQTWLTTQTAAQESKKKYEMPALKISDLRNKQDDLYKYVFFYFILLFIYLFIIYLFIYYFILFLNFNLLISLF